MAHAGTSSNAKKRRSSVEELRRFTHARQIINLFKSDTDMNVLNDRDLIIEAVFENMDVKKEVFIKLNKIWQLIIQYLNMICSIL